MCEYYQNSPCSYCTMFHMTYNNWTAITLGLEPTGHHHNPYTCAGVCFLSCTVIESFHNVLFFRGGVCKKRTAKHPSIPYYCSIMLLFTQFVHSFQTAVSCDRLQEQNYPSIVLLGEAQPCKRNKQKEGGGCLFPPDFSFMRIVLLSAVFWHSLKMPVCLW